MANIDAYRSALAHSHEAPKQRPICQNRNHVRKDIWFSGENIHRLHYKIESDGSALTIRSAKRKVDIVEQLECLRCWMQDTVDSATGAETCTQQTRYFTADKGTYNFLTQELIAQQATLSLYRFSGEDLPDLARIPQYAPFLMGSAATIYLQIAGHTPCFEAKEFKASLKPGKGTLSRCTYRSKLRADIEAISCTS